MSKNKANSETWISIVLSALAVLTILSLFEHDNSKIISKKGSKLLENEDEMDKINQKIDDLEKDGNNHQEVII